jgi:peptidyl-prolyl cis-trans isomerase C
LKNQAFTFALLSVLALAGCKGPARQNAARQTPAAQPKAAETPAQTTKPPEPPKPVPQQIPPVVARVNGVSIERAEFERAVKMLEARAGGPVPAERRDEILRGVLDNLVTYHVLSQEAHRRELDATPEEVQARMAQVKQQFPNEQAFAAALKERNMDPKAFAENTKADLTVGKLMQAEAETAPLVGEADAKEFYDKNPDKFQQPEQVRASHIFKRVVPGATPAAKQKARSALEPVLKQVKAGSDFGQLAKTHSEDASAQAGGDLNFFGPGQMVPEFEKVAFALKPGETSDIVESQFGYHIIKVTERRAGRTVPFAEAKGQIAEYLKQQRQQEKTNALVEQLKAKAKIEILM